MKKLAWYIGKSYYEKEDLGNAIKYFGMLQRKTRQILKFPTLLQGLMPI